MRENDQVIAGVMLPAFIRNGSHHFINLPVYADGAVDCWELVDRRELVEKVRSGWLCPSAPDGARVSVFHLGFMTASESCWELDEMELIARIDRAIRAQNPRMENLFARSPDGGPRRLAITPNTESFSVFAAEGDQIFLAELCAFADETFELRRLPEQRRISLEQLRTAFHDGRLTSEVAEGTRIHIQGLGSFRCREASFIKPADKLGEILAALDKLNGRPDATQRCLAAFKTHQAEPTEEHRAALEAAYLAVPAHLRCYLGDMDVRDHAIRKAIAQRAR